MIQDAKLQIKLYSITSIIPILISISWNKTHYLRIYDGNKIEEVDEGVVDEGVVDVDLVMIVTDEGWRWSMIINQFLFTIYLGKMLVIFF